MGRIPGLRAAGDRTGYPALSYEQGEHNSFVFSLIFALMMIFSTERGRDPRPLGKKILLFVILILFQSPACENTNQTSAYTKYKHHK